MEDFITKEGLATVSGMMAAVSLIVEFTKRFLTDYLGIHPKYIRLYATMVSFTLLLLFGSPIKSAANLVLAIINAILISLTSMGFYAVVSDPKLKRKDL